ncbi:unnamed protein product [Orchesella dallaii]|uniref:C2H2-type domain-containing protein n=1 Tax=Orchesella dallaii TaxID=48710 RepID=A0ABP1RHF2_9HEXA
MDLEIGMKFCFVCCKRVQHQDQDHPLAAREVVDERDGEPSLSSSSRIYLKFVELAKSYLQLGTTEVDRDQDDSSKVEAFCESCEDQLKQIFELYEEFCELERRLSSKFVELAKLMKESSRHAVTKDKTKPGIKELIASKCLEKYDMLATGRGEGTNLSNPEEGFLAGDGDEDDYGGIDVDVKIEEIGSADEEEVEVEGEELTAEQTGDPLSLLASPKTTSVMSDDDFDSIYVPDSQSECEDSDDDDDSNSSSAPGTQSERNDTDDDVNDGRETKRKRIVLTSKELSLYLTESKDIFSSDNKDNGKNDKAPDTISSSNFVCDHCYKHFDTAHVLYTHLFSHENQSTGQGASCPFCYKKFFLPQTQELHMQIHHPSITATEKPFVCDGKRCTSAFKTLSELNEHIGKHSKDVLLECSVCQWGFIHSHHLKVHEILHTEPRNKEYHCTACKCRFQRVKELQIHFNFKHGPSTSVGLQLMNTEVLVEEPKIVRKQICRRCKAAFPIEEDMTLHSQKCAMNPDNLISVKTTNGNTVRRVRCHFCEKMTAATYIRCHLDMHFLKENLEKERQAEESDSNAESSADERDSDLETNLMSKFTCNQCNRDFLDVRGLFRHLEWHEKQLAEQGKPCNICYRTFVLFQTLQVHLQLHHPSIFNTEKPFLCDEKGCQSSYKTVAELNEHITMHSKPTLHCSVCQWGFVNPNRHKLHEIGHTQRDKKGEYGCPSCKNKYRMVRELQIHYDFKHGALLGVELFKCSKCNLHFRTKSFLRKHMKNKHEIRGKGKKYQCPHCKVLFRLEQTLSSHMKTCPNNPTNFILAKTKNGKNCKKFRCNQCGTFVIRSYFRNHLRTHMDKQEKEKLRIILCDICGNSFNSYDSLKSHVDRVHRKIIRSKNFTCEFCGISYKQKPSLNLHVEVVHKGVDLRVICNICVKVLANRFSYSAHMRNHKEGKRCACHLCDRRFGENASLKNHLVKQHGKTVGEEFTPGRGS